MLAGNKPARLLALRANLDAGAAANALRDRITTTATLAYDAAAWASLARSLEGVAAIIKMQIDDDDDDDDGAELDCASISNSIAMDLAKLAVSKVSEHLIACARGALAQLAHHTGTLARRASPPHRHSRAPCLTTSPRSFTSQ